MGEMRNACKFFYRNNGEERGFLGDLGVDRRIILECTFNNYAVRLRTEFFWFRI
jgi:hypothetical protein